MIHVVQLKQFRPLFLEIVKLDVSVEFVNMHATSVPKRKRNKKPFNNTGSRKGNDRIESFHQAKPLRLHLHEHSTKSNTHTKGLRKLNDRATVFNQLFE